MAGGSRRCVEGAPSRLPDGVFDEADVASLPVPVSSYFRSAVEPGTPLAQSARIRMRGMIPVSAP